MKKIFILFFILGIILFTSGCIGEDGAKGAKGVTGATGAKGDKGADGLGSINVNYTFTNESGTPANVINIGNSSVAYLDFYVPKGEKGDKGDAGDAGAIPDVSQFPFLNGTRTYTGNLNVGNYQITNIDSGTSGGNAVNKTYADSLVGSKGYTIPLQALTSSPTDGQTVYFGALPKAPTTTQGTSKQYIPRGGTIKRVNVYTYSGTAGTNELWQMLIRINGATDTRVLNLSVSANERRFYNDGLSISVNAGDYFEIKGIQPTWATNPATTIYGGTIYVE